MVKPGGTQLVEHRRGDHRRPGAQVRVETETARLAQQIENVGSDERLAA